MSNSSGQNDPSTDEILSSIRRIISEDSGQAGEGAASDDEILELTDEVAAPASDEGSRPEPVLKAVEPSHDVMAGDRQEPVLGMQPREGDAYDAGEPAPLAMASSDQSEPEDEPEPAPPTETEQELTESAAPSLEDEIRSATPGASASMFGAGQKKEDDSMAMTDESPAAEAEQASAEGDEIMSDAATNVTAATLGELSRAMDEKGGKLRLGDGDVTVSDLVKEMMRPMLREWMDQNLPGIVERIVRREIQKLVDRSLDDD